MTRAELNDLRVGDVVAFDALVFLLLEIEPSDDTWTRRSATALITLVDADGVIHSQRVNRIHLQHDSRAYVLCVAPRADSDR